VPLRESNRLKRYGGVLTSSSHMVPWFELSFHGKIGVLVSILEVKLEKII
jgi:hypothetical protein